MNNSRIFAIALLLLSTAAGLYAHDERPRQKGMRMMQFDADKAVMIDEAGMVIAEKDAKLTVEFIGPKETRPKETAGLDIAVGDEVGMAAGKRISSVKLLREAYDSIKPGEEFKLGLRRNGKAFVVSFAKKDPKDLPKKMVIRRGPDENPNRDVLPALGVAIEPTGGKIVIMETLPNAPKEMSKGDVILSLNGKVVKTLDDFAGVYDKVETGGELKFEIFRDGKTITVVTKRKRPQGKVNIN